VVTGIPSSIVRSSSGTREMCRRMLGEERLRWETVTSILVRELGRIIHRAAADQWLKTASGPEASTAAIQRPSRGRI
jgi:hypothetical protein